MTTATPRKKLTTSAMIASFADPDQRTSPAPFGHALAALAEQRPEIVGLSADLAKYTDMHVFRDAHLDRFFQMGMAEQVMLGAAAGMAEVGIVPFASTYSVFATRRAYDFLCLDIAEPGLNVNVVGGLPGLTTGYGPSHQATEDLAILRGCPGLTIVDPCDSVDIAAAVPALADHPGPTYLRLLRGSVPTVLDEYDYRFELGKAAELRTGRDVLLISTGLMTMRALQAAARLEADHVDVAAPRPHHQAARPRGDRACRPLRPPRDHLREPHGDRWARRGRGHQPRPRRRGDAVRPGRPARRVPRRRRPAHAARPVRPVHRRPRRADQGRAGRPHALGRRPRARQRLIATPPPDLCLLTEGASPCPPPRCRPETGYVTGATYDVNGGSHIH
jgi:transketolase C-terminal domain/subunit